MVEEGEEDDDEEEGDEVDVVGEEEGDDEEVGLTRELPLLMVPLPSLLLPVSVVPPLLLICGRNVAVLGMNIARHDWISTLISKRCQKCAVIDEKVIGILK